MADFPKLARIKQDDENMEKIHCAARRGQTELIRRLIAAGISPTIPNKFGCTALHLACKHGHVSATRELAPQSDPSSLWHGQRPLHLAVLSGNVEVVQVLIESVVEAGKPADAFLAENDEYPLHEIGQYTKEIAGQTALHLAIGLNNSSMIDVLLNHGASPFAKDRAGETALMRTVEFNQPETFTKLLKTSKSLRLDICDKQGRSTLHWALMLNRPEMAQQLLDAGHDVNVEDADKVTPFVLAAHAGFPHILDTMLASVDQFLFQSSQFHNGLAVQPERLVWLPSAEESSKLEVQKLLQKKLDAYNKDRGVSAPTSTLNKTQNKGPAVPLTVAPSAPVKK